MSSSADPQAKSKFELVTLKSPEEVEDQKIGGGHSLKVWGVMLQS